MISEKNLKKMRDTQNLNLPENAYLQAWVYENDSMGGQRKSRLETLRQSPARIGEPKGELEKEQAGRLGVDELAVITMPAETDMTGIDEIQIRGRQWHVHWTNASESNLTALRVMVTEIKS